MELIEGSPFHFVGSLPPSDHPDLLGVGKDHARLPGLRAFETTKVVFGSPLGVSWSVSLPIGPRPAYPSSCPCTVFGHAYVSHLIEDGVEPLFVQHQVGHSWASTTAVNTSVGSDHKDRMLWVRAGPSLRL